MVQAYRLKHTHWETILIHMLTLPLFNSNSSASVPLRFQLVKSMERYMDASAKIAWKKSYRYGRSSSV